MRKNWVAGALAVTALSGCLLTCVARGTWVRTPRGRRRIETLGVGDEVCAVDPERGTLVTTTIVEVRSSRRECVQLTAGEVALTLTSDHPVFCPRSKQWAPAGDWALGRRTDLLCVRDDGGLEVREVREVNLVAGLHDVFDITVASPLHDFVANGVVVHNKTPRRERCTLPGAPDAGQVYEYERCSCGDAGVGTVVCTDSDAGTGECEACQPQPSSDGGADGGADGGP